MALACLELLKKLKRNPCNLPDFVMNRDVSDVLDLLEDKIGGATRYACAYWAMHIRSSPTDDDHATRLITSVTEFLKEKALPWIEVMGLEKRLEGAIHNINNLLDWLGTVRGFDCHQCRTLTYSKHRLARPRLAWTVWRMTASDSQCTSSSSSNNLLGTSITPPYPFRPCRQSSPPCPSQKRRESPISVGGLTIGGLLYGPFREGSCA